MPEPLLNSADLGRVLHRSPAAVLQARYRGSSMPPAIKIGSRLFWRPEDVDAWIESHRERDNAAAGTATAPSISSSNARMEAITHGA